VAEATALRVRQAVAELGYVPQAAARSLASRRTHTLGLLLPSVDTDFFFPILRGIDAAAREAGFDLLIAIHAGGGAALPLGEHNTDGLIVFDRELDDASLCALARAEFPLVLLYRSAPAGCAAGSVLIENRAGAFQAVSHLIEAHGCRRILFLAGPPDSEDAQQRAAGFRAALEAHGLHADPALELRGDFDPPVAQAALARALAEGLTFDAVFACDDESAQGALAALQQAGRQVPGEVALMGFDDLLASRHLTPPLSTVRAPTEQVGRAAVQMLVQRLRGEQPPATVILPTELVVRQSCGCESQAESPGPRPPPSPEGGRS
jgi:DNA-binding LacI/PurR family transcriptional regulator